MNLTVSEGMTKVAWYNDYYIQIKIMEKDKMGDREKFAIISG